MKGPLKKGAVMHERKDGKKVKAAEEKTEEAWLAKSQKQLGQSQKLG